MNLLGILFSLNLRHLHTRKLRAGDILFDSRKDDKDFYIVIDGKVSVFVKGQKSAKEKDEGINEESFDSFTNLHEQGAKWEGHHLLNEVISGGTVSSLFAILTLFTEDLDFGKSAWLMGNLTESPKKETADNQLLESELLSSVHRDLVAKASVDTTLAVIPAKAFKNLTIKFPSASAHIVQVILARFQRVTFMTLYKYLGLSKELLKIEKMLHDMTKFVSPREFNTNYVENLMITFRKMQDAADKSKQKKDLRSSHNLRCVDATEIAFELGGHNMTPTNEFSSDLEVLKDSVSESMLQLIGAFPIQELHIKEVHGSTSSQTALSKQSSTPGTPQDSSIFPKIAKRNSSNINTSVTFPQMRMSYVTDDESTAEMLSRASSNDDASSLAGEGVEILFFPKGATLIKEGERSPGLFFVVEGVLEAGMKFPAAMLDNGISDDEKRRKYLFYIPSGGIAGYMAAVTSFISFASIRAKTDCCVGFMSKEVLDNYVEKFPSILLSLANRIVKHLPPLILHIDAALEWGQINAGQVLCRQGETSNSIYVVLTGRLRSIAERIKDDGKMDLEILGYVFD
jgi:lysophospholipid hydrolase